MAYTANTGFRFFGSVEADQEPPINTQIRADDSQTIRIGDLVRIDTAGLVKPAATGEVVGGVCVGLVDENGINVFAQGVTNNTGATLTGDDTVTTSSTNSTKAHYVNVEVSLAVCGTTLWLNKADSALAQTNLFQFFDAASGRQVTVGSASDANGQLQLIRLDPNATGGAAADTTIGVFRINETQFSRGIDSATAKLTA